MSGSKKSDRPTNQRFSEDSRSRQNSSSADETLRGGNSGEKKNFQFGKDLAPDTVDPQFLIRIGAKRLNNGTLVDRNGYELKTRDPDCQAPSPPTYNPGREARKSKYNEIESLSQEELDKKARQQIEMMKKMQKEEKKKREQKKQVEEEEEGEDEYEEVDPEEEVQPPPAPPVKPQIVEEVKIEHSRPKIPRSHEQTWYSQYKKQVETLRDKVYGNYQGPPSTYVPQSGYFFRAPPIPVAPVAIPQSIPQTSSWMPPPTRQIDLPPRQVDLPPPGLIPEALFPPSETPEAFSSQYGIRSQPEPVQRPESPDSDEEAMRKLMGIIKQYRH